MSHLYRGNNITQYSSRLTAVTVFLHKFNNYRNANYTNETMQVSFQRANLLLTLMSSPKIDKWAALQGEELTMRVFGNLDNNVAPIHLKTDEALWNNLCLALKATYSKY